MSRVEVVEERAAQARVFERSDGLREVELYSDPQFFETGAGDWVPIDTTVAPVAGRAESLAATGNQWTATFSPVDGGGGLSVTDDGLDIGVSPRGPQGRVAPEGVAGDGSGVVYRDVWAGTDLRYTVTSSGVKEDIVVRDREAPASFGFDVRGAEVVGAPDGGAVLRTPAGEWVVPPPTVLDAAGFDVTEASGVVLRPDAGGAGLVVSVDPAWLGGLDEAAFPLAIDPTIVQQMPSSFADSWSSAGRSYSQGGYVQIGRDSAGVSWRGQFGFPYEQFLGTTLYRAVGARLALWRPDDNLGRPSTNHFTLYDAANESFAGTLGAPVAPTINDAFAVVSWGDEGIPNWVSAKVQDWMSAGARGERFGVVGNEAVNGSMGLYRAVLTLTVAEPPPATTLQAMAPVLATRTPTLTADPISSPETVFYQYEVSSAPGAAAGGVVRSGWTTATTWIVPDGSLRDGVTYWARVYTNHEVLKNNGGAPRPPVSYLDRSFRVALNLGGGGPSPTERAGTVPGVSGGPSEGAPSPGTPGAALNVNLVNGNLAASVPTHSVSAVAGAIAPSLVYNSRADTTSGLMGSYYSDDGDAVFEESDPLRGQRPDPVVNFTWDGARRPVAGMPPGPVLARWDGYVTVPSSGSWELGVVVSTLGSRARIFLDGEAVPALDAWAPETYWSNGRFGAARSMTAGVLVPIRVEFATGDLGIGGLQLVARQSPTSPVVPVEAGWVSQSAPDLPDGWQLSAGSGPVTGLVLEDLGDTVVFTGSDGSAAAFRRVGGAFVPPVGSQDHLMLDGEGRFVLRTAAGTVYTFRSDGRIETVTTGADGQSGATRASFEYRYEGSPLRLTEIVDPVSQGGVGFLYGGAGHCVGPVGMLCRIGFWDGATTTLSYDQGRLSRVSNQGYPTSTGTTQPTLFDFAYDASGRLDSLRDPLAADLVAYGVRADGPLVRTEFDYDTTGRLTAITNPARRGSTTGRSSATYDYDPVNRATEVHLAYFAPSTGFARRVTYDDRNRIVSDTDATGNTRTITWDARERVVTDTDHLGLRTTHAYDDGDRRTDSWGPAPVASFGTDNRPLPGAVVARSSVSYDDGLAGLAATYWDNRLQGGPPAARATGLGTGALTWSAPPRPGNEWSMVMTGEIALATSGQFGFNAVSNGRVRLWVADVLVLDAQPGLPVTHSGGIGDENFGGGRFRIRVEYTPPPFGTPSFALRWKGPYDSSFTTVPDSVLYPAYGLATRATGPDGLVTATEYSDPARNIGAHHGVATATVVDPGGLALRTSVGFEDPTTTNSYLRRQSRTLPAGNTTTTAYYGATQGPVAPVCGVSTYFPQRGAVQRVTGPDPDGAGPGVAVAEEFVYDGAGRVAGARTATTATIASAGWACTYFDSRGRVMRQTWPADGGAPARDVEYLYAVGGDPLRTTVSEAALPAQSRTVTTLFDLSGRVVEYGTPNLSTYLEYDLLGREERRYTYHRRPDGTSEQIFRGTAYDPGTGRLARVFGTDETFATPVYDQYGRVASITYRNGTTTTYGYDQFGRTDTITHWRAGVVLAADRVTYSVGGRVTDQQLDLGAGMVDPNPGGANFAYDTAGRLLSAYSPAGRQTYSYAPTGCAPTAGRNTNRTSVTRGTVTATYCYDNADRLTTATGVSTATYDAHGNTTRLGSQTYTYDAADRHSATRGSTASVSFVRDPLDRIVSRQDGTATPLEYRYGAFGDTPVAVFSNWTTNRVLEERLFALPGGVTLAVDTVGTYRETWSYPNLHGDTILTTNQTGTRVGPVRSYSAYGEGTAPDTHTGTAELGYLGQHSRFTQQSPGITAVTDMGARPYRADLGRFLSTDPVEGGCANSYVYGFGDPVNGNDITGTGWWDTLEAFGGAIRGGWDATAGRGVAAISRNVFTCQNTTFTRTVSALSLYDNPAGFERNGSRRDAVEFAARTNAGAWRLAAGQAARTIQGVPAAGAIRGAGVVTIAVTILSTGYTYGRSRLC